MTPEHDADGRYWRAHPLRAFGVRAVVFAVPLLASVASGMLVSRLLPTPGTTPHLVLWWVAVLAASTVAVIAADREARRLLPLATLLQLSMLFPDKAPSRLKIARRVSGSRAIAQELAHTAHHGVSGDRQQAAETILALVGALGDYDSRTRGHSERTQLYVTMLASELQLKDEDKGKLMWAALVHDIGKLKVPHEVLNKPGTPTEDDWHVLHSHPVQGAQICEPLRDWLGEWWLAIEEHHEKYDGSGYPRGLAGNEISYGARIVAVADSYEVMTASRAYKRPMSAAAARQELIRCAGTHFDPSVVRAFLNLSLGRTSRYTGPLAWLAQFALVRPGPVFSQVLGATAGAGTTALSVAALSLGPLGAAGATLPQQHDAVAGDIAAPTDTGPTDAGPSERQPSDSPPTHDGPGAPTPTDPTDPNDPDPPDTTPGDPGPAEVGDPILGDDAAATDEDHAVTIAVLVNDHSADGSSLDISAAGVPAHGSVTITGDQLRYTPDANFNGVDTFAYAAKDTGNRSGQATVSVSIASVNDPPRPVDDALTMPEDLDVVFGPLDNDADPEDDALHITSIGGAAHGTVTSLGGERYTYRPASDFHGTDRLSYTVTDGHGGSSTGNVILTVTAVNDTPVVPNTGYSAQLARRIDVPASNGVLANASDVDGDSLSVVTDDSAAVTIHADGSFNYLPVSVGTVSVRFIVSDGQTRVSSRMTITTTRTLRADEPLTRRPNAAGDPL